MPKQRKNESSEASNLPGIKVKLRRKVRRYRSAADRERTIEQMDAEFEYAIAVDDEREARGMDDIERFCEAHGGQSDTMDCAQCQIMQWAITQQLELLKDKVEGARDERNVSRLNRKTTGTDII